MALVQTTKNYLRVALADKAAAQDVIDHLEGEEIQGVQDDVTLPFGDGDDAAILWSTGDASNHSLVVALGDSNQALHITDLGAKTTDWNVSADTHPTVYVHSNTTPATDYLKIGAHTGTAAEIDVVGGTTLTIKTAGTARMSVIDTLVGIGDTAHAALTQGLVINQGASDDMILALKSSDVATGLTTGPTGTVETDDFFAISKAVAAEGGTLMQSFSENAATTNVLRIESYGGQASTTHSTAGRSLAELFVTQHDGANALSGITADGNVFGIRANVGGSESTIWLIDEDGAPNSVIDHAAFADDKDDVALIRSLDYAREKTGAKGLIKSQWDKFVTENEDTLVELGVLGCRMDNPNGERPLMNLKRLAMLQNGAIWQLFENLMDVVSALPAEVQSKLPERLQSKLLPA